MGDQVREAVAVDTARPSEPGGDIDSAVAAQACAQVLEYRLLHDWGSGVFHADHARSSSRSLEATLMRVPAMFPGTPSPGQLPGGRERRRMTSRSGPRPCASSAFVGEDSGLAPVIYELVRDSG